MKGLLLVGGAVGVGVALSGGGEAKAAGEWTPLEYELEAEGGILRAPLMLQFTGDDVLDLAFELELVVSKGVEVARFAGSAVIRFVAGSNEFNVRDTDVPEGDGGTFAWAIDKDGLAVFLTVRPFDLVRAPFEGLYHVVGRIRLRE